MEGDGGGIDWVGEGGCGATDTGGGGGYPLEKFWGGVATIAGSGTGVMGFGVGGTGVEI